MQHWLIKSEPDTYSWTNLQNEKIGTWDGVRNYQARNNLKNMKLGDKCLFYHSVSEKAVVGVCEVYEEFFVDTSYDNEQNNEDTISKKKNKKNNWVAVKVTAVFGFEKPVYLHQIKENPLLQDMKLLQQTRLSVCPITLAEFEEIVRMGSRKQGDEFQ